MFKRQGEAMKPRHFIPAILLGLLIAYPLSLGPVVRLQAMQHPGEGVYVPAFYYPIVRLCEKHPTGLEVLGWYIAMWTGGVSS